MSRGKKIALGCGGALLLFVAAVLVAAALQPDHFRVERSRTIAAGPDVLRPQLTDLRRWAEWNPWSELDPEMEMTFSDPPSGEGAWYQWKGNDQVGQGRMTITEVTDEHVRYDLEFLEPFASEADIELRMEPSGDDTHVTWAMEGDNDFMAKLFGLFMSWEDDITADFDHGLENLEAATTAAPPPT